MEPQEQLEKASRFKTLNQQRKEIHSLEQALEKERFTAAEKVKTLLSEIQMLRTKL